VICDCDVSVTTSMISMSYDLYIALYVVNVLMSLCVISILLVAGRGNRRIRRRRIVDVGVFQSC
jgi:hypothetical protein